MDHLNMTTIFVGEATFPFPVAMLRSPGRLRAQIDEILQQQGEKRLEWGNRRDLYRLTDPELIRLFASVAIACPSLDILDQVLPLIQQGDRREDDSKVGRSVHVHARS